MVEQQDIFNRWAAMPECERQKKVRFASAGYYLTPWQFFIYRLREKPLQAYYAFKYSAIRWSRTIPLLWRHIRAAVKVASLNREPGKWKTLWIAFWQIFFEICRGY